MGLTTAGGRIVKINILLDPERLRRLDCDDSRPLGALPQAPVTLFDHSVSTSQPAALQDVMVVRDGNEWLARAIPEHEGVERGQQQTRRRLAVGPCVGLALRVPASQSCPLRRAGTRGDLRAPRSRSSPIAARIDAEA